MSEGCKFCYAEINTPSRVARAKGIETWGKNAARIVTGKAQWNQVRLWNKKAEGWLERPRVFCHSLSDVFEDYKGGNVVDHNGKFLYNSLDPVRCELFRLIMGCPNLDFLLLTKRPENIIKCLIASSEIAYNFCNDYFVSWHEDWIGGNPPDNVWLGTSVENQKMSDKRIPELIKVPAKIRFLSCEPLLGKIDLYQAGAILLSSGWTPSYSDPDNWGMAPEACPVKQVDQVICGGESGSNHRPMDIEWARLLQGQCKSADIKFFMKQLGGHPDKRDNFDLFPDELKCQEFPV